MRRHLIAVFAALATLSTPIAGASTLNQSAFTQVPSRFMTRELTLGSRGLGEICYSRGTLPDGSVCNPAYLDEVPSGFLMGRAFIGNGYTALNTANELLFQPISRDFLQSLFRDQSVTSLETNLSLAFAAKNFSASFSPYRVQYFSEVHNPNFPVIAMHAAVERALTFSGGSRLGFLNEDVSVGAKLRLLQRQYIHGSYSLAETLSRDPRDLVPIREHYAAFVDPTIGWRPSRAPWNLSASVGLVNIGAVSVRDELYHEPIDLVGGVGIEPPVGFGRLRVGVDAVNVFQATDLTDLLRAGVSYQLGILEAMAGINRDAITSGLQFGFQVLQVGIVYEFNRSEVNGGFSEKRISTEISVRL